MKGSPNKFTRELKEAILNAFEKVGGESYLVKVARTNPKVFCGLLARVLPLQVTGLDGKAIEIKIVKYSEIADVDNPPA